MTLPTPSIYPYQIQLINNPRGQICLNLKRIYVHESIFPQFKTALIKSVQGYTLGDGSDKSTSHGPLQNAMQYDRVKTFFADIKSQGWDVAVGGEQGGEGKGYFITPTVIDRPPEDSRIVVEEPFGMSFRALSTWSTIPHYSHSNIDPSANITSPGPIVPLLTYATEEEVIARANNTRMGLGASVWTNDLDKAARVARELQAGTVWVNTHFDLSPIAPFGGHKESGVGTEWGVNGLKGFCNVQTLFLNKGGVV